MEGIPDLHLLPPPLQVCVRTHAHVLTFMDVSAAQDSSSLMLQCTEHAPSSHLFLSALRGTAHSVLCSCQTSTCSRVQTSFDGTIGDHMSIVVNRMQREIVCFLLYKTGHFPAQNLLRIVPLTRTLSVDTLFGGSSSSTSLLVSSLLFESENIALHILLHASVIGDIRRRLFSRAHEFCHCRHRVLGSGGISTCNLSRVLSFTRPFRVEAL